MKKETLTAIFFGVLLGVGGALLLLNQARQIGNRALGVPESQKNQSVATGESQLELVRDLKPKDGSILNETSVIIQAKTNVDSLIVAQSPITSQTMTNSKEDFSLEVPLALGENVISVTAYPKDTTVPPQTKIIRIYRFAKQ